jgi:hypothetical protein
MVKHARFSNMPLLAKNRRFNQTKEIPPTMNRSSPFKLMILTIGK